MDQVYPNWELCVCCDEDIEERIRGTLSRYQRLDERIKVGNPGHRRGRALERTLSLATGEFAGVLGDGDELAPDALFEVVKLLQEHTDSDLIFSDEDEVDEVGSRARPRFKPDWAPDLLLSSDYISRLSVYRMSLLKEVGGFREGLTIARTMIWPCAPPNAPTGSSTSRRFSTTGGIYRFPGFSRGRSWSGENPSSALRGVGAARSRRLRGRRSPSPAASG